MFSCNLRLCWHCTLKLLWSWVAPISKVKYRVLDKSCATLLCSIWTVGSGINRSEDCNPLRWKFQGSENWELVHQTLLVNHPSLMFNVCGQLVLVLCWATPNIVECYNVVSVCTPCCMLLHVIGSCRAKFETGQTLPSSQGGAGVGGGLRIWKWWGCSLSCLGV